MKKRLPLQVRMQRWAQLANIGRLMLNEIDVHQILEAAANEVWRSMRKHGRPEDPRGPAVRQPPRDRVSPLR